MPGYEPAYAILLGRAQRGEPPRQPHLPAPRDKLKYQPIIIRPSHCFLHRDYLLDRQEFLAASQQRDALYADRPSCTVKEVNLTG